MSKKTTLYASAQPAVERELFYDKKGRLQPAPVPLAPLVDTHGHLTCFKEKTAATALARAALAGVGMLVVPLDPSEDVQDVAYVTHWLEKEIAQAQELLATYADAGQLPPIFEAYAPQSYELLPHNVYVTAGVHPYGALQFCHDANVKARLMELIAYKRCIGIGEIGLDFGPYNELSQDVQELAFREQLRLAHKFDLPVELHIRDNPNDETCFAHVLAARILREEGVPARGCDLHCFTQNTEVMQPFVELGCHIAFGGALTFKKSDELRAAACVCPQELLFSETDCPYMAPHPLRGCECEPAMVSFTVDCLAQLQKEHNAVPLVDTYTALWENAHRFFQIPLT